MVDEITAHESCPSCGRGLRPGAAYCSYCGTPVITQTIGLCPTCNVPALFRRWAGNPWFCTNCGAHVEVRESEEETAAV
jgi:uncharacterized Zn finger protein (UPF0148 family)